jgi:hypothetical protein
MAAQVAQEDCVLAVGAVEHPKTAILVRVALVGTDL